MGEVAERAGVGMGACATTRDHAARHGRHPCALGRVRRSRHDARTAVRTRTRVNALGAATES